MTADFSAVIGTSNGAYWNVGEQTSVESTPSLYQTQLSVGAVELVEVVVGLLVVVVVTAAA